MRTLFLLFAGLMYQSVSALSVFITKILDAPCGNPLGALVAEASGGVGTYSYQWSNGATTAYIDHLLPGNYTVTVTDGNLDQAQASMDVLAPPSHPFATGADYAFRNCPGFSRFVVIDFDASGLFHGPAPHTITNHPYLTFPGGTAPGEGWFMVSVDAVNAGEQFDIQWTDAYGCPGTTPSAPASSDWESPDLISLTSTPACNGNNGGIHFTFSHVDHQYTGYTVYNTDGTLVASGADALITDPITPNVNNLAPGGYWLLFDPDAENLGMPVATQEEYVCTDSFYVEIEDHSGSCGVLSGTAFFDHDQDCVRDAGEPGIPGHTVTVGPGGYTAITNENGAYSVYLPNGSYTAALSGTGVDLFPLCPATPDVSVNVAGANLTQHFADSSIAELNVRSLMSASTARPGFQQNLWLRVNNTSGRISGALDITLNIDPMMSFVSATVAPTSLAGNTVTWTGLNALSAYQHQWINVQVQVPPDIALLGQAWSHTLSVAQALTESDLADNSVTTSGTVTGSYDPNEKSARTSSGTSTTQYFTGEDEWIDYTIDFQNTGTDTAFTVVVKDSISPLLDMSTIELGVLSHAYEVTTKPGRVLEWRFANILLPDSTTNEPLSHGRIDFRIRPVADLPVGSTIDNTAGIYFDYNPPVRTNTVSLAVENSTLVPSPTSGKPGLWPNPVEDRLKLVAPDGGLLRNSTVDVFSAVGTLVKRSVLQNGALDVAELAAGHYTVRFMVDGRPVTQAFLKR